MRRYPASPPGHSNLGATHLSIPKTHRMIEIALLATLALPQSPNGVVINEFSYDDSSTDDMEYVELYNGSTNAVDMSGWTLACEDQNGPDLVFTIANGTVIQPGAFFVVGAALVPNVGQSIVDPNTGVGQDLFQNGPHDSIELRDASGAKIDRVDYETYASGWLPTNMEGDGCPGGYVAVSGRECSMQRNIDGFDTDDNGADFRYMPWTPGTTNRRPNLLPYINFFDTGAPDTPITDFGASFVEAKIIDPQTVQAPNPLPIPPSPQGGNASIYYDPTGGGNTNMLLTEPIQDVILEVYAYFETAMTTTTTDGESWSIGVRGTNDAYAHHPFIDPAFGTITGTNTSIFQTGLTGIAWVYQRTQQYNTLWLVDWNNGGTDFTVLGTVQIQAGVNDGWQRLKIRAIGDRIEADFGGTYGQDDGTHFSGVTGTVSAGGIYVGYREFLVTNSEWRPITLDYLTVFPGLGEVRTTGTGSMHTSGTPSATVNSLPYVGSNGFRVEASSMVPSSPGVMLFGTGLLPTPFDLGALGAPAGSLVYVSQIGAAPVVGSASGNVSVPLPIPNMGNVAGVGLEFQFLTVDLALPNSIQVATSNAVGVTIAN